MVARRRQQNSAGSRRTARLFGQKLGKNLAMKNLGLVTAVALMASFGSAQAHIRLDYPMPRTLELKTGPCGAAGSTRGSNVTVLAPGATIEVKWTETVNHPGHYRVSFDPDGQDFTVPLDFNDFSQTMNVLVDNIPDRAGSQLVYKQMITLPNMTCENCTLQVIQMMTDKAPYGDGNDLYFQCADIALRNGAPTPDAPLAVTDANGAGGDAGSTPAAKSGCQTSSGSTSWFPMLGMVGFGAWVTRRRRTSNAL